MLQTVAAVVLCDEGEDRSNVQLSYGEVGRG